MILKCNISGEGVRYMGGLICPDCGEKMLKTTEGIVVNSKFVPGVLFDIDCMNEFCGYFVMGYHEPDGKEVYKAQSKRSLNIKRYHRGRRTEHGN